MSIRINLLFITAASLAVNAPASAQGSHTIQAQHVEIADTVDGYEGEWRGYWMDGDTWIGTWDGVYSIPDSIAHTDPRHLEVSASPDGRLGYSMDEREAWLSDCRLLMADQGGYARYADDSGASGGVLTGALLGAAIGGLAGNRIADDNRLAGTLIGTGAGGLAGAAVGSAFDEADRGYDYRHRLDANEIWAARYCDAYLRRYETSAQFPPSSLAYSQPVSAIRFGSASSSHGQHGHRHASDCTTTIREEWVEDGESVPTPGSARRVIERAPTRGKTLPLR